MEILVLDTRCKAGVPAAQSVGNLTGIAGHKLVVVRKALEIGHDYDTVAEMAAVSDMPILVVTAGYSAMTSGGYVTVLGDPFGGPEGSDRSRRRYGRPREVHWVGGLGYGNDKYLPEEGKTVRRGDGLRPWSPVHCWLYPAGTRLVKVKTHGNPNQATAAAARAGLRAMAQNGRVLVSSGDSAYTAAWELIPGLEDTNDVPDEHQTKVFSMGSIALKTAANLVRGEDQVLLLLQRAARGESDEPPRSGALTFGAATEPVLYGVCGEILREGAEEALALMGEASKLAI